MAKINQLQPSVFNMIAAGEVVERPASVVKELVENSIDAGATEIAIDVLEGGIKRIQVSDDGIGIAKEDMRLAFMPHATSKLNRISDLDNLSSLGFRGEALASISSVAEVTMISRAREEDLASKIVLNAGKVVLETDDSRAQGTIITIDNLFFNTPARLKFLKNPSAEQKAIQSTVVELMLANPSIAMTLVADGKVLLQFEGGSLLDCVCAVYGADIADGLVKIDYQKGNIRVGGYTSKTNLTKPTRAWQTYIVNGRAVENKEISISVDKAYENRLVKHNYPICVLDVVLPFDEVDVNVHPRKSEVRFRTKQAVFGAIYSALSNAIDSEDLGVDALFTMPKTTPLQNDSRAENFGYHSTYEQQKIDTSSLYNVGATPRRSIIINHVDNDSSQPLEEVDPTRVNDDLVLDFDVDEVNQRINAQYNSKAPYFDFLKKEELKNAQLGVYTADENECFANSYNGFDGKIIGQIFSTYIVVERDETVYLIDQHAAHERILYDKLIDKMSVEYIQPMLIPYKFRLSPDEEDYLCKLMPTLSAMGFDVEKKSDSYFIYAVPSPIVNIDMKKFIGSLFTDTLTDEELSMKDVLHDTLCMRACKSAIKGGDALNPIQIEALLNEFIKRDGKLPEKCPHGRPAVVALTKRDVERMFKRIVN